MQAGCPTLQLSVISMTRCPGLLLVCPGPHGYTTPCYVPSLLCICEQLILGQSRGIPMGQRVACL